MVVFRGREPLKAALLASTALIGAGPALAQNLPTGGSVAHGGVTISTPSANQMSITQSTSSAIVNWQGFSIGQGRRVDIQQPSSSAAMLNRVTGSTPSTIAGQLNANGQVYLVNPNGIAITKSGTVNAGGFVASTLGISDEDFKAGRRTFRGNGSSAAVSNAGAITIDRGGYAALLGGKVENSGTISVPTGKVGLGAAEQATLDLSGDGFLQVAVPSSGSGKGALIRHSGLIQAGRVEMKAATAREAARRAINLSGTVEATSVGGRNGAIILGGGAGGSVRVTGRLAATSGRVQVTGRSLKVAGTIDASGASGGRITLRAAKKTSVTGRLLAMGSSGKGGTVKVLGETVALENQALVDVSGASGGGTALIGGDYQGKNPDVPNAKQAFVGSGATIRADATQSGDGGKVIVWSDETTRFHGSISARGGIEGGDGGFVEVSGKRDLAFAGAADTSAPKGRTGTLLLDPETVIIDGGGPNNGGPGTDDDLAGGQVGGNAATTTVTEATLESLNTNIEIQATKLIRTGATPFTDGKLTIAPDRSLTLVTRNLSASGDGGGTHGIDLTNGGNNVPEIVLQGSGSLTVTSGNGDIAAPVTLGRITTAGGSVRVTSNTTLAITGAITTTRSSGPSGAVTLMADDMALTGAISAPGQTVTLRPRSVVNIDLGTKTAGKLGLTNAELNQVTAGTLVIGGHDLNPSVGSITVSAPISISPAKTTRLSLRSNDAVSQNAGATITVNELAVTGSPVTLNEANNVSKFAGGASLDLSFNDAAPSLTIDQVDGLSGIRGITIGNVSVTNSGSLTATANGPITGGFNGSNVTLNAASILLQNAITTNGGSLTATATGTLTTGSINTTPGSSTSATAGGNVTLTAGDAIAIAGAIDASGRAASGGSQDSGGNGGEILVRHTGAVANRAITLNAGRSINSTGGRAVDGNDTAGNGGIVTIVNESGNIVLNGSISTADGVLQNAGATAGNGGAIQLRTASAGNTITQAATGSTLQTTNGSATPIVGRLLVDSTGSALLQGNGTNFAGTVAARVTDAGASFTYGDGFDLTVGTVAAAGTQAGTAGLSNLSGVASSGSTGTASITTAGRLTVNGGAPVSGRNITLTADDMTVGASVNAGSGTVTLRAVTAGRPIDLGLGSAGGSLGLSTAELNQVTAGTLVIGRNDASAAGAITVSAAIAPSGTSSLSLVTGSTITQTAGSTLTIADLSLSAGGTVTLTAATNNAAALSISAAGQAVSYTDADALALGPISAGTLSITAGGPITQSSAATVTGTSSFSAGANAIALTNSGNDFMGAVSLSNSGPNDVSVTDTNAIVLGASFVGSGTLTVNAVGIAQTGAITQAASAGAATFNGGAGVITLTQANDFTGPVSLNNSGANDVTVSDTNGITLGASSVGGNLAINGGAVTVTAPITSSGSTTITNAGQLTIAEFTTTGPEVSAAGGFVQNGSGQVLLGGEIATDGSAVSFASNVTLTNGVTITTDATQNGTAAGVTFSGQVNGAQALTVNSAGATAFTGAVGGVTPLTSVTTDAGGTTAINGGAVTTTGAQSYGDPVTLSGNVFLVSDVSGAITFANTVDSAVAAPPSPLTVTTAGQITLGGAVGGIRPLDALTTNGGGPIAVNGGAVATNGAQSYDATVTLGGASGAAAVFTGGSLAFNGASALTAGNHPLALTTNALAFAGPVSGTSTLLIQPNADNVSIGIAGGAGTLAVSTAALANLADGFSGITIGRATGAATTTVNAVTFKDPVVIRQPGAGGRIVVNGHITGTDNASIALTAGGDLALAAGGAVTSAASGDAVVLATDAAFLNERGADAVQAPNGRWLIYSADPTRDTFGNLDSGNTAIFNATLTSKPPVSVSQAGNRYLFAIQPTLTVTSTDAVKTYGDAIDLSGNFTVSGFRQGVAGAFRGDTVATATMGSPSVSSSGAAATAGVSGSPYEVTVARGSLTSQAGYALAFNSAGRLTVSPRPLQVTADNETRLEGQGNPPLTYTLGPRGLVNGDTLSGALATAANTGSPPGAYSILQGTLTGGLNYVINFIQGTLTVVSGPPPGLASARPGPPLDPNAIGGSRLASTVVRDLLARFLPPFGNPPPLPLAPAGVGGPTAAQVLVEDPRFAQTLLCFSGAQACTVMPPAAP